MDFNATPLQCPYKLGSLVRRNAPGDTDRDSHVSIVCQRTVNQSSAMSNLQIGSANRFAITRRDGEELTSAKLSF